MIGSAPHPRSYGTFPRVLGRYVRERYALTLEDAGPPYVGFAGAAIEAIRSRADPSGHAGLKYVVVNGKTVIDDGKLTSERPGRILYGPGATEPRPRY